MGTKTAGADERECNRRVLQVVELMHGVSIAEATQILEHAGRIIGNTTFVDITNGGYASVVAEYKKTYGDDYTPPVRQ